MWFYHSMSINLELCQLQAGYYTQYRTYQGAVGAGRPPASVIEVFVRFPKHGKSLSLKVVLLQ
jgi:hypothetical protein